MQEYEPVDLSNFTGTVKEWITQDATRKELMRRFRRFLQTYGQHSNDGNPVYMQAIERMCAANKQSLEVSFLHLSHEEGQLAGWLADVPRSILPLMNDVASALTFAQFPDYDTVTPEITVRITDLPLKDELRDLRHVHLNALLRVSGVVTRRTGVFPQLKIVRYTCLACGALTDPITVQDGKEPTLGACLSCQEPGPYKLNTASTIYGNFQKLTLQESPGSVPAGRVPRSKDVILLGDLIDCARPGEEVDITGVYQNEFDAVLNAKQGFPVFRTVIVANFVDRRADGSSSSNLTTEEQREIEELARDPRLGERILASVAPSIYGNEAVKLAVAMSLFAGVEKDVNGKHRVRGDINVLLLGHPGTAKSQILKYCEQIAPRAVYTTGKGASAVGLTAAVRKDVVTREWTLEGGALVLADRGVCLIDEFDKMNDADRTSIHEAMEQQSISVSKAGIVTTLQARCAVIAAANPVGGRYDAAKTFAENVQLTDPILQRFDILTVLQDTVDPVADERLASFVVDSHVRAHPDEQRGEPGSQADAGSAAPVPVGGSSVQPIPQHLLRKYIQYARQHCKPSLTEINKDKVATLYGELRRESEVSNGIPIAVRHIESMMRISEAHARMHLRSVVSEADVDMAIRVMLESFIHAQKFAVMKALRRQFSRYLEVGRDHTALLLFKLQEMVREAQARGIVGVGVGRDSGPRWVEEPTTGDASVVVPVRALQERAARHGLGDRVNAFLASREFAAAGFQVDARKAEIRKVWAVPSEA